MDRPTLGPVVFLSPWDRLIGPNRYLVDMLGAQPGLARSSVVVLPPGSDAADEYREIGCRVAHWQEVRLVHPRPSLRNAVSLLASHTVGLITVTRKLGRLKPTLVVSNSENLWLGGMASALLGVRHVQIFHSLVFDYRWSRYSRTTGLYLRSLAALSTRLIAVSDAVSDMLTARGIDAARIAIIPNAFDCQAISSRSQEPLRSGVDESWGRPLIVSVGRLAPMKGQDVLIDALRRLRRFYPSLTCLIIGGRGSAKGVEDTHNFEWELRRTIEQAGLAGSVRLMGESTNVPALIASCDVYVQPSRTESFSRPVAEALICERPVVATSVGGIPEVVGVDGALLVPPGSSRELADALDRLLSDPACAAAMAKRGRAHVASRYDVSEVSSRLADVLDACRRPGGRRVPGA